LVGSGQSVGVKISKEREKEYVRAVQELRVWLGDDAFKKGVMGLVKEILERIGDDVLEDVIKVLEEKRVGLNPQTLREAFRLKGFEVKAGFAELVYKCLKEAGKCIEIRAVTLPVSTTESGILTLLRLRGPMKFSQLSRRFPDTKEAVLNLLKKELITVSYGRKTLSLEGINDPNRLLDSEIKRVPEAFLVKIRGFKGESFYQVSIPSGAKVSLKWT